MQSHPVNELKKEPWMGQLVEEKNYLKIINIKDLILSFYIVELMD